MDYKILILLLFSFGVCFGKVSDGLLTPQLPWLQNFILSLAADLPEDARLNFTQLANKYGMECEEHDVITEDGYILKMFHIPGDATRTVLIAHGFIDSSDSFMIRGDESLTKALAERGCDVWLGNFRGNRHSRRHVSLNPEVDAKYWDFSAHEQGVYDLPAFIDHVLLKTGRRRLYLISHSEGGTSALIMGSVRPGYNEKVGLYIALASITDLSTAGPVTATLLNLYPLLNVPIRLSGVKELFRVGSELSLFAQILCSKLKSFCYNVIARGVLFRLTGKNSEDPEELGEEFFQTLLGHYPSGSSVKNLLHMVQNFEKKRFAEYDYGVENLEKYGSVEPPSYELNKVVMKTAIFYTGADGFVSSEGMLELARRLPNVVDLYRLKKKDASHLDFVYGKHMDVYFYPHLFEVMANHTLD